MSIHRGLPVLVILAVCGGLLTLPATNAQALASSGNPCHNASQAPGEAVEAPLLETVSPLTQR
ncbi:hypothetical protein [Lactiplantibacillus plantarum]|uniref:hypothetical protein n=1 Tax=Lactiplantibacillus plantarum TaxID=1590 RepID=UPI003F529774